MIKTILAFILGAIVGYPISYFLQSGLVREKMSLGEYIQHADAIFDAINEKATSDIAFTAIGTMLACGVICAVVTALVSKEK